MNQRGTLTTEILEVPGQKCPLSLAFDCELLLRAKIRTMAHHCNFPGMNSDMRSNNVKMFHSHMIMCRFHQRSVCFVFEPRSSIATRNVTQLVNVTIRVPSLS